MVVVVVQVAVDALVVVVIVHTVVVVVQICVVTHVAVETITSIPNSLPYLKGVMNVRGGVVSIVDLVVVTTVGHALANVKAVLDALVAVDVIMVVMGSVRVAPMAALEDVRPLLLQ